MENKQLRRWSPGDVVRSASRLNEPIDILQSLLRGAGRHGGHAAKSPYNLFRMGYVMTVDPVGGADGEIRIEWSLTTDDDVPAFMWPALYPSTGYTYTNNNQRQLTAGAVDEELVPELVVGEILQLQFCAHPDLNSGQPVWIDCNRVGRMWGEVV